MIISAPAVALQTASRPVVGLARADTAYAAEVPGRMSPDAGPLAEAVSTRRPPGQVRVRRDNLEWLRARGMDPYAVGCPRTRPLAQARAEGRRLPTRTATGRFVAVMGTGMGIDHLLMNLTALGIRDTILFPLVRPSS